MCDHCILLLLNKQVRSGCFAGEAVAKWMAAVGEASCIEESCAMCDRYVLLALLLLPLLLLLLLAVVLLLVLLSLHLERVLLPES
jgi:hypothetical protein